MCEKFLTQPDTKKQGDYSSAIKSDEKGLISLEIKPFSWSE